MYSQRDSAQGREKCSSCPSSGYKYAWMQCSVHKRFEKHVHSNNTERTEIYVVLRNFKKLHTAAQITESFCINSIHQTDKHWSAFMIALELSRFLSSRATGMCITIGLAIWTGPPRGPQKATFSNCLFFLEQLTLGFVEIRLSGPPSAWWTREATAQGLATK